MKYLIVMTALLLSACSTYTPDTNHNEDVSAHQRWLEHLYTNYDAEYIEDCFYYEDLVCDFE